MQSTAARIEVKALGHRILNRVDVGDEGVAAGANPREAFLGCALLGQGRQLLFKIVPLGGDFGGDLGKGHLRLGRHQARGCRGEGATLLGDRKSGGYLWDGPLVYLPLGIADLVEGKPSHQARDHGEDHGRADAHVQMKGDAVTSCEHAFQ